MGSSQSRTCVYTSNGQDVYAIFEDDWFDKGESRYLFRGRVKPVGRFYQRGTQCVVKLYNKSTRERIGEDAWKADNHAALTAREKAQLFNNQFGQKGLGQIDFVIPDITTVERSAVKRQLLNDPVPKVVKGSRYGTLEQADEMIPRYAKIAIEPYMPGRYCTFLSNSSYIPRDTGDVRVLVAFCHFTYHESGGEILVSDLQGVWNMNKKIYRLTDPAIHSSMEKFGSFGRTDLGIYGMAKFFQTHECNELCEGLQKPDMSRIQAALMELLNKVLTCIPPQGNTMYIQDVEQICREQYGIIFDNLREMHRIIRLAFRIV